VPICTFTLRKENKDIAGEYIRLSDFVGSKQQPIKAKEAVKNSNVTYRYTFNQNNFKKIPGGPVAYWATDEAVEVFNNPASGSVFPVKKGSDSGNNDRFLRQWYEVSFED